MEINPRAQFVLLVASFLTGLAMGVLWDALAVLRVLLGAYRPSPFMRKHYARKLPLLRRTPVWRDASTRRAYRHVLTLCFDVLFCLAVSIAAIILLYEYNDGVVRPFAILVLLAGLAVWRVATARLTECLIAVLAYAISVFSLYMRALLLLPWRVLWRFVKAFVLCPVSTLIRRLRARRMKKKSEALCRGQLLLAACGLDSEKRKREGRKDSEAKKKAGHDGAAYSCAGRDRILRRRGVDGRAFDGTQSNAPRDRGAAKGKGASRAGAGGRSRGRRISSV